MWGAVMSKIHSGLEAKSFDESSYAVERYYCTSSGLLATDACPSKAVGWYKKSNVPGVCTAHAGTALDAPSAEAEENTDDTQEQTTEESAQ